VTGEDALPTPRSRATAVVEIVLDEGAPNDALALDVERDYRAYVRIQDRTVSSAGFRSPLGDERWRDVVARMRASTAAAEPARGPSSHVFDAGRRLYDGLAAIAPELATFLANAGSPRRLVVASDRPEIHRLPWEALIDARNRHVADGDLSVVHALVNAFEPVPWSGSETVRVAAIFGPDTPGSTRDALARMVPVGSAARGLVGDVVRAADGPALREHLQELAPDIVHVEAHGDNERATIQLAERFAADPTTIATTVGPRPIVLFWSCYSGLLQSWGESAGLTLHRAGALLVAGFSTEIRQETAGQLANRFYGALLDAREGGDPETGLTRERARLFRDERRGCVWASLTVWLRQPVDLAAATADGPRLPADAWMDAAIGTPTAAFEEALRKAGEGRHHVLRGSSLPAALPGTLVAQYPGAVVRLSGHVGPFGDAPLSRDSLRPLVEALGGPKPRSQHPADAVLSLLRTLATYRRSLLVWSGASRAEVTFFDFFDALPRNLSVVLATDDAAGAPAGADRSHPVAGGSGQPEAASLERLDALVETGRFEEADRVWRALEGEAASWGADRWERRLAWDVDGFWIAVKLWRNDDAEKRTAAIEGAAKQAQGSAQYRQEIEWRMLRGNLLAREGRLDEAYELYREARGLAEQQRIDSDVARASAETAYLLAEMGDAVGAEQLYRTSLRILENVDGAWDRTWRSALARTLRDLADLLLSEPARREESRELLERSLALHALDGRYDQLGAVLRTRGRLFAAEGRDDLAERSLEASAAVSADTGNAIGWAATVRELASLALRAGRAAQCTGILQRLVAHLEGRSVDRSPEVGLAALQLARGYWQLGRPDEALRWCQYARGRLPDSLRHEHAEASNLERVLRPLAATPSSGTGSGTADEGG
jgi:tetratricopeptide (TPR) repeat protein